MPQQRSRGASGTRPTTDRVREALFNVLASDVGLDGARVLDLYAGSGALGIEAVSRGAASAVFVESDRRAAAVLEANLADLGVRDAVVRRATVTAALASAPAHPVDLVLADPPYDVPHTEVEAVLAGLSAAGWVAPGAVAVVERPAGGPELTWSDGWTAWQVRRYGDTRLEFGEYEPIA